MKAINLISFFLATLGNTFADVDLPVPQTFIQAKYPLPKPYKEAIVTASGKYDSKHDDLTLRSLIVQIDSNTIDIPKNVLKLFGAPRLDTLRLFAGPSDALYPTDPNAGVPGYFAVTFKFLCYVVTTEPLDERPNAWIEIRDGKVSGISRIDDIRKQTAPSISYDLTTLKPLKRPGRR